MWLANSMTMYLLSALGFARAARGMARFCSLLSSGPPPHSHEFQIWVAKFSCMHSAHETKVDYGS